MATGPLAMLDATRLRTLRLLGPLGPVLVADRSVRIALGGSVGVLAALVLVGVAPLGLLAFAPLLLGVPHLLADVRYLVVGPGLHRRRALLLLLAPLALAGAGWLVVGTITTGIGAALVARAPTWRRLRVLGGWLCVSAALLACGGLAPLVLGHLHNLVALVLFATFRSGALAAAALPLALTAGGLGLVAGGAFDAAPTLGAPAGLSLAEQVERLAPGLAAPWGVRLVLAFAFLQSVHYVVWLRLVPEAARARETSRTFRSSWRALRLDVGALVLGGTAAVTVGLAAWGLVQPVDAGDVYLRLALFHGPLEFGALVLAVAEGRRPGSPG